MSTDHATATDGLKSATDKKQENVNFKKFHRSEIIFLGSTIALVTLTACATVLLSPVNTAPADSTKCFDICKLTLVETIPDNLTFPSGSPTHLDTYASWNSLIDEAVYGIDIGSSYWTLREEDVVPDPSAWKGEKIFDRLLEVGKDGGISIRIAQNNNSDPNQMNDTTILANEGAAAVRTLDFDKLLGAGILHTKMWMADNMHFYVGSANLDWRSLTQVKELGIMVTDCACMGRDLQKVFSVYWKLGEDGATVPAEWPPELATDINLENPTSLEIGGLNETMYISVAPPQFLPEGRTSDLTALLDIIDKAQEFIYIALMDYFPVTLYQKNNVYWPIIDNRLRAAAFERGVKVRLMPSWWKYSKQTVKAFLRSLEDVSPAMRNGTIEVKMFEVPAYTPAQENLPYSRVNHNKYMVTETTAFIGTSNWSGDYFLDTAGVSVIISQKKGSVASERNIHVQLKAVFERDWNSPYARTIDEAGT
ncbi:5'-3' exonuclease PLD3-like [Styela clava]